MLRSLMIFAGTLWLLGIQTALADARDADLRAQSSEVVPTGDLYVNTSTGGLYLVQAQTGAAAFLMTTPQFFDIALDGEDRLFGVTAQGDLYRIFPMEKSVKRIGNAGAFVNALTFDRDGTLLAAGYDRLYTIALETGRATQVAIFPGFNSSGDLSVGSDGALYATTSAGPDVQDSVVRIDSGRKSIVPVGQGTGFRNIYGMIWLNGRLLGVTEARELIAIDPGDGTAVRLKDLPIDGLGYGAAKAHDSVTSKGPGVPAIATGLSAVFDLLAPDKPL